MVADINGYGLFVIAYKIETRQKNNRISLQWFEISWQEELHGDLTSR